MRGPYQYKKRAYKMTPDAIRMREAIAARREVYGYTYAPGERKKRGIKAKSDAATAA